MKYLKKFENHSQYEATKQDLILPNVSLCQQENEVHYNPYVDPYNGHEYVDLGLPSETKWATMNVGAENQTNKGLYFAWGETEGYVNESTSIKDFRWDDYQWTEDDGSTLSKYNATDSKTVLDLEDDAANVNWGGGWHMPTKEQCEELLNTTYVINAWVTNYQGSGVNGLLFTSVSNGNTMFVPAAGYWDEDGITAGRCHVWSACVSTRISTAYFFSDSGNVNPLGDRCDGKSVRGVVG